SFKKQPELGYVLPFKVFKLMCINSESGILLFKYNWDLSDQFDELLLSGTIQGVSSILKEGIQKGFVREVKFDEGIMIIYRVELSKIMFVLLSSKSSPILIKSLHLFGDDFIETYKKELASSLINSEDLKSADSLIEKRFPFVPKWN
ncbi:MAG: hypothetical protein ACTSVY_05475, partial [Candidatus Helarchaeota archaeon]